MVRYSAEQMVWLRNRFGRQYETFERFRTKLQLSEIVCYWLWTLFRIFPSGPHRTWNGSENWNEFETFLGSVLCTKPFWVRCRTFFVFQCSFLGTQAHQLSRERVVVDELSEFRLVPEKTLSDVAKLAGTSSKSMLHSKTIIVWVRMTMNKLRPIPHSKSYFCLRTSDLNETFTVDVSWALVPRGKNFSLKSWAFQEITYGYYWKTGFSGIPDFSAILKARKLGFVSNHS